MYLHCFQNFVIRNNATVMPPYITLCMWYSIFVERESVKEKGNHSFVEIALPSQQPRVGVFESCPVSQFWLLFNLL